MVLNRIKCSLLCVYRWLPLALIIFLFGLSGVYGQAHLKVATAVADRLYPAVYANMKGFIDQRLHLSYVNGILARDVDRLIAPFRNKVEDHWWQTEFWGKWFTSAVLAYKYHPTAALKAVLEKAVHDLIATQDQDGYIGNYAVASRLDQWDIWGRKYCMLGLLAYYDITKDKRILRAATGIADHLIRELDKKRALIVEKGNFRGMAASSVLEPIVQLYARTADKKYLVFAEEIVRQWELPVGPKLISKSAIDVANRFPFSKAEEWTNQGQKAYEMMSCYEGLIELYRITGKQIYRTAVEDTWKNILNTEISILGSGSASECWFHGEKKQQYVAKHFQETCVTATWIKLNQQLLRLSGDAKYADVIEKSFYNALLGSMRPDGTDWGMYAPSSGIRSGGSNQCEMGLNCCVASGPRALFTLPLTAVMNSDSGLTVNFFNEGSYQLKTPKGGKVTLNQSTTYPVKGKIDLQLQVENEESFSVNIRIPAWSERTQLSVNGIQVNNIKPGQYMKIERKWKTGDQIELSLDMRARENRIAGQPSYLSIQRGPIVLTRDTRLSNGVDIDEVITPVLDQDGTVQVQEMEPGKTENIWMAFSIPCIVGSWRFGEEEKPVNLTFCDYSSAGNTFSSASRYRFWFPQLIDPTGKDYIAD